MATHLDRIVAAHRAAVATDERSLERLIDEARSVSEPVRDFAAALRRQADADGDARAIRSDRGRIAVIAEVKRRSPSKGPLAPDVDPASLARAYAAGGAACLSVLTDREFFGGSATDLAAARSAVELPVLRKDFTVAASDVCDTRLMGADAVLLIVAALDDTELCDFLALAGELGLVALVEVHDEAEVERAIAAGAEVIGVNQRDLVTFDVDTERAVRVAGLLPPGVIAVAESGINGPADIEPLRRAGYHAVLVGEHLVRSPDPAAAVAALRQSQAETSSH